jgi:ribosomal protein S18 acetylase RimI-like enzyme
MIIDAIETDSLRIEEMAGAAGVFGEAEMAALEAVWEEYLDLGPEDSGYSFLVDREGKQVLGFVCYGPRELTDGVCDLYYLVVDAKASRQSVGRRLLKAAEAEAREACARIMMAEVSGGPRHAPMRALLASAGYEAEAIIKDFYEPGDDLTTMVKRF